MDYSYHELTGIAEGAVYDRLSLIDGIAQVTVRGDRADEFRVTLNNPSLLSRGLTVFDVSDALSALRNDIPLGTIESSTQTLALRVGNPEVTVETIEQIPIDATTRVSDIAFVQLTAEDRDVSARVNGVTSIGLDITRQSVGNTLTISQDVRAAVDELQADLPDGIEPIITTDDGVFIENSISEVVKSILLATCIVIAVIFAFLRSFRATLIPAVTIPVALVGTLAAIWLVMLIGVMAKNGILIVEFANQLREAGQDIDSAIRDALRLRIRPVLMTMVSTVCGGLPLILTSGAGAEARIAVGWVIVGGLGFATAFTLFLTPVFYRWIAIWGNEPGLAAKRLSRERRGTPTILPTSHPASTSSMVDVTSL